MSRPAEAERSTTDALVRRLSDESEIRGILARYARGIDRRDMDTVRSCYHPDATDAHGHYNGDVEGFIQNSIRAWTGKSEAMSHNFGQALIEIDGDTAWVESYCVCVIRLKPEQEGRKPKDRIGNIRYVDLFERRNGEWRIAHRKVIHSPGWLETVEVDPPLADQAFRSRPDFDDPSYDRRPESFLPS